MRSTETNLAFRTRVSHHAEVEGHFQGHWFVLYKNKLKPIDVVREIQLKVKFLPNPGNFYTKEKWKEHGFIIG